jgi:hypothetical protein
MNEIHSFPGGYAGCGWLHAATCCGRVAKYQVTAGFGQPTRVAKLGAKEIYHSKDMKVTFTNGKVTNVE